MIGCEYVLFQLLGESKTATIAVKGFGKTDHENLIKFTVSNEGVHNFSVVITSAFAELYYIEMGKFVELCEKYV